jgi:serine phosphatase RsbU (regulator of sigma subunit)
MIDLDKASLTYCSAGHPPALLLRAAEAELVPLDVQSGVVGAFPEMRYRDGHATLMNGDVLLLYTDGTTEARATDGRFFGEDGLRDAVMRHASDGVPGICQALLGELDAFTDRTLEDDVALVALRFDEVG